MRSSAAMLAVLPVISFCRRSIVVKIDRSAKLRGDRHLQTVGGNARSGHRAFGKRVVSQECRLHTQKIGLG